MNHFEYKSVDGKWQVTESVVPDDDTEQKRRMKKMAEQRPGSIVFGYNAKTPMTESEDEKYLEDM